MLSEFEAELLEESVPQDGYFAYSVKCANDIEVRICFHAFYYALQVDIYLGERKLSCCYQEGCVRVHFDDRTVHPTLLGEFVYRNGHAKAKLVIEPEPMIEWQTFVTNDI